MLNNAEQEAFRTAIENGYRSTFYFHVPVVTSKNHLMDSDHGKSLMIIYNILTVVFLLVPLTSQSTQYMSTRLVKQLISNSLTT